jgi:mycothiol maleylpyruvate isomerase-like protein
MGRREELLRSEAEGWERLQSRLDAVPPERLADEGLNAEGWAARDLMWHVAFWCADAARVLEEIRAGTFDRQAEAHGDATIDAINDRELERSRATDVDEVRDELHRARASMLERFGALEELTAEADEWFEEAGPLHYAEHLVELDAWIRTRGT